MDQGFFDRSTLGVGAVEHRVVAVLAQAAVDAALNAPDDGFGLGPLTVDLEHLDGQSAASVGPQTLIGTLHVLANNSVGGVEDVLGRTVVLLEFDNGAVFVVLLEIQDVPEIGPAPAVNALPVVTDDGNVAALIGQ